MYLLTTNFCSQCLDLPSEVLPNLFVDHVDILTDDVAPHHYKSSEDLRTFKSEKTKRGPLVDGWKAEADPVMCSYKAVEVKMEVWGLQTRLEEFIHKVSVL